jgi:hypothetical protein
MYTNLPLSLGHHPDLKPALRQNRVPWNGRCHCRSNGRFRLNRRAPRSCCFRSDSAGWTTRYRESDLTSRHSAHACASLVAEKNPMRAVYPDPLLRAALEQLHRFDGSGGPPASVLTHLRGSLSRSQSNRHSVGRSRSCLTRSGNSLHLCVHRCRSCWRSEDVCSSGESRDDGRGRLVQSLIYPARRFVKWSCSF